MKNPFYEVEQVCTGAVGLRGQTCTLLSVLHSPGYAYNPRLSQVIPISWGLG
jgi:hypothetical protein